MQISNIRRNLLRAVYAMIAVLMGFQIWPVILLGQGDWSLNGGVVKCMLGALTLLAILGIRYPMKMLPLLFWELGWKAIWLAVVALPAWLSGNMDEDITTNLLGVALIVPVFFLVPWGYVMREYGLAKAENWRNA